MKIITNNNANIRSELARDFRCAGKVRHYGTMDVDAFRITPRELVDVPYTTVDGEIFNTYVSWEQKKVLLVPQMDRDLIIPLDLVDFTMVMDLLGQWKQRNPKRKPDVGVEPVVWHDPMVEVEFDD